MVVYAQTGRHASPNIDANKQYHPAFQFSVLTCNSSWGRATKIIYADDKEASYNCGKFFRYKYCELGTLEEFADVALAWLFGEPCRFIIRGQLLPDLDPTKPHYRRIHERIGEPETIECPPRRWIVLDIDGARVPIGHGAPDKLAEAGAYIRDNKLPEYFRGVRCVASATAGTGRKGPTVGRLRLFFVLKEPAENDVLRLWATGLAEKHGFIDPSVMREMQPIYTARPIFHGYSDPVPEWGRVRILDGHEDELALNLKKHRAKSQSYKILQTPPTTPHIICTDLPEEAIEMTAQDAGHGVSPIEEISDRAWKAIKEIFDLLDGCPKRGVGRHVALNKSAYWLARLTRECEITEAKAREAYWEAVKGIDNSDKRYSQKLLERHIDDAFTDASRRPC